MQGEVIECKYRVISSTDSDLELEEMEIEAEPEIFKLITHAITSRSRPLVSTILEKYETRRDAIMLFQVLAYVMEHCRVTKKRYLNLYPKSSECETVKMDLQELISFPKQCCNKGCIKDGVISCSRCKVACWCAPECLEADFTSHQIACTVGEHILSELHL